MLHTTPGISASDFVIRASFVIGDFVIRHYLPLPSRLILVKIPLCPESLRVDAGRGCPLLKTCSGRKRAVPSAVSCSSFRPNCLPGQKPPNRHLRQVHLRQVRPRHRPNRLEIPLAISALWASKVILPHRQHRNQPPNPHRNRCQRLHRCQRLLWKSLLWKSLQETKKKSLRSLKRTISSWISIRMIPALWRGMRCRWR